MDPLIGFLDCVVLVSYFLRTRIDEDTNFVCAARLPDARLWGMFDDSDLQMMSRIFFLVSLLAVHLLNSPLGWLRQSIVLTRLLACLVTRFVHLWR